MCERICVAELREPTPAPPGREYTISGEDRFCSGYQHPPLSNISSLGRDRGGFPQRFESEYKYDQAVFIQSNSTPAAAQPNGRHRCRSREYKKENVSDWLMGTDS